MEQTKPMSEPMTDEAIIKQVANRWLGCGEVEKEMIREALRLAREPQWVSVSDRPPTLADGHILVVYDGIVQGAEVKEDKAEVLFEDGIYLALIGKSTSLRNSYFTHWQPAPPKPQTT